jgi:hypothetical protein
MYLAPTLHYMGVQHDRHDAAEHIPELYKILTATSVKHRQQFLQAVEDKTQMPHEQS